MSRSVWFTSMLVRSCLPRQLLWQGLFRPGLHRSRWACACLPGVFILLLCLVLGQEHALALGSKGGVYSVGYRSIGQGMSNGDKIDGMSVGVWFPTDRAPKSRYSTKVGNWVIKAERDKNIRPAAGLFPVILLSHDMARQKLANHDLCSALAEAGFVVIAPTHLGDNVTDSSAVYSAALLYHRPRQLFEALDMVMADPLISTMLNRERIGLLGVGTGAVTVLQSAGVDIDAEGGLGQLAHERDSGTLHYGWRISRMSQLAQDLDILRQKKGRDAFKPYKAPFRAVALLTPGWLSCMHKNEMKTLSAPLAVMFAGADELAPPPVTPEGFEELFPRPLLDSMSLRVAEGIDHYGLSAGCIGGEQEARGGFCSSNTPAQLTKAGKQRDEFFINFFKATLGVPVNVGAAPVQ